MGTEQRYHLSRSLNIRHLEDMVAGRGVFIAEMSRIEVYQSNQKLTDLGVDWMPQTTSQATRNATRVVMSRRRIMKAGSQ